MSANAIQFMTLASALSLEIGTGLKANSHWSTLSVAKRYGYTGKQRKIDALAWVADTLLTNGFELQNNVVQTLEKNGYSILVDEEGEQFID